VTNIGTRMEGALGRLARPRWILPTTARAVAGGPAKRVRGSVVTAATIRCKTTVHYRDLEITILRDVGEDAWAIAGYDTPQELVIAAIAVRRRRGRRVYCLAGTREWTSSLETVARAAVHAREARDARVRLARRTA
jgi:hypothetical protein